MSEAPSDSRAPAGRSSSRRRNNRNATGIGNATEPLFRFGHYRSNRSDPNGTNRQRDASNPRHPWLASVQNPYRLHQPHVDHWIRPAQETTNNAALAQANDEAILRDIMNPGGIPQNEPQNAVNNFNAEIFALTEHMAAFQRQFDETMRGTEAPAPGTAAPRNRTTRAERRRHHIDKEESEVVLAKFWDIVKVCDEACPSVRENPAKTNSGILIPDNHQKYSEETALKLSQLTQYSETDMTVDKTRVALATANAIGSMTVLYEALGPLLTQKKELKNQLDVAMASLNKIVTTKTIAKKSYHASTFEEGMTPADKMQVSTMLKETNMFKGYLRQWWNRIYDTVAQLMGLQHDTRQHLENVDFRL